MSIVTGMKAAVVEDETLIRAGIRKKLELMGIEVVFDTDSGPRLLEYLDKADRKQPDILLTDICMPIMDGLEMIEKVRKKRGEMPIVVLSGFNNFEYARQAIRLEVYDYLLKPIDRDELASTMDKLAEQVKEIKEQSRERLMQEAVENLANHLSCSTGVPLFPETRRVIEEAFPEGFYIKLVLLSNWQSHMNWFGRIQEREYTFIYPDRPNLLVSFLEKKDAGSMKVMLKGIPFTAFYSAQLQDTSGILHVIRRGIRCIKDHLMLEKQLILEEDEKETAKALEEEEKRLKQWEAYYNAHYDILERELEQGNIQEIKKQLAGIMCYPGIPQSNRNQAWLWMTWKLCGQGSMLSGMEDMGWLQEYDTLEEFTEGVAEAAVSLIEDSRQLGGGEKEKSVLDEILDYVRKNYAQDITLKGTSEKFFINRSHLARIFKQKTGTTFNNFLTELRIEKAWGLMQQGVSIAKAAELVGYENSRYFSRVFCKVKGCIPSKFKEESEDEGQEP